MDWLQSLLKGEPSIGYAGISLQNVRRKALFNSNNLLLSLHTAFLKLTAWNEVESSANVSFLFLSAKSVFSAELISQPRSGTVGQKKERTSMGILRMPHASHTYQLTLPRLAVFCLTVLQFLAWVPTFLNYLSVNLPPREQTNEDWP